MTPEDLGPEVCHREHRNEDQNPEGHGLANGASAPGLRFSATRTYRETAGPVVHDGLVSPLLIRANVPGASCHRVTSRLSRVLT